MRNRLARLGLVACLAAVFVLTAIAPAFAAAVKDFDLPAGTRVEGKLAADDENNWKMVVHKGQVVDLTLKTQAGYSGQCWMTAFDSVATTNTAAPFSDLAVVTGVGTAKLNFKVPYDTVVAVSITAPSPGNGAYTLDYAATDTTLSAKVDRVFGADRFATSIKTSQSVFATSSAAIVATGRNFADALAASGLAGSYDCPVLLTEPSALSAGVDAEITRLGATKVFVVGSSAAVSDSVFGALKKSGRDVVRLEGPDRFATAAAIAKEVRTHEAAAGRTPSKEAFVVNGLNFPDALSVSPFAFSRKTPILLVRADSVPPATADELRSMGATAAYVAGGPSVVSTATMNALGVPATRIAGAGRMETAIAVADYAAANGWSKWEYVGLATGWNYPDALGGGVALGKRGGALLLTQPTYLPQGDYGKLYDNRVKVKGVSVFGSTVAVFGAVTGSADHALAGDRWADAVGNNNTYGINYVAR